MSLTYEIIICVIAGIGAGLGVGLAGMSAATIISPMLISFLSYKPYLAVGVALCADFFSSIAGSVTYAKHKNIDIRNGIIMMVSVLAFTLIGSLVAKHVPDKTMGGLSMLVTFLIGVKFLIKPVNTQKADFTKLSPRRRTIESIIFGAMIGFVCGFIGVGGGMMMLITLTTVLDYDLKTAVGTSLFIMIFTALVGAGTHFVEAGWPNWMYLGICAATTLVTSVIATRFANKASTKTLNRAVGILLTVMGAAMLIFEFILKERRRHA